MLNIHQYKEKNLCKVLFNANNKLTPLELIQDSNQHIKFLKEYLGDVHGLGARFYVIEKDYINVDYLTDYSFYYSKSFSDYSNKCVRIHFFTYKNNKISDFRSKLNHLVCSSERLIDSNEQQTFYNDNYLGFIVVRPIPSSIIGYSILKHYNYNKSLPLYDSQRQFWGIKDYNVNFFGTKIKISSLAFMSQDGNVAACATIAVWCMLQIAVENYFINLKSPYEITKDAGITVHNGNRLIPNTGLDPVSICTSITKSNLVTEIRWLRSDEDYKSVIDANLKIRKLVNAYSNLKLPIILGMYVPCKDDRYAGHAVAISGHYIDFSESGSNIKPLDTIDIKNTLDQLLLRAYNINILYAHDDQWGPFAKMTLTKDNEVITSWTTHTSEIRNCIPIALILSVFQKVRITFEEIENFTFGLNYFLLKELGEQFNHETCWDIKLYYSTDFQTAIKESGILDINISYEKKLLVNFLTEPMPKYIWVSTLYSDEQSIISFIYDATGLKHANCLLFSICYYPEFLEKMTSRLKEIDASYTNNDDVKIDLQSLLGDSISHFVANLTKLYK